MKFRLPAILLLLALGGYLAYTRLPVFNTPGSAQKAGGPPPAAAITATEVMARDVPLWRSGLGTVQAFNTVTVRPRVSGMLDEVNFTEGQAVQEGDVLAKIDPRPYEALLAQAKGKLAQSTAQLGNARDELKRVSELVNSGAESRQKFDQLSATVEQFEAQQLADIAGVRTAQLDLDFTTVRAPISGRTGIRQIDKGNLVTANQGAGLVTISQFHPISVIFTLPQQELGAIQQRMATNPDPLLTQAVDDDGKILGEGKLDLVDNQIDTNSGTLRLKATFPNANGTLWPGQFITGRVLVETRPQAIVIPTQVINAGPNGPFAYVVKADDSVEVRNLVLGPRTEAMTLVEEGLKVGETVVLDGQSKLRPGATISIQPAQP
jgi:multidrug efflux system membrane fusion protein